MIKSLSKHGNSMALVIEKPILELLDADQETQFKVVTRRQFAQQSEKKSCKTQLIWCISVSVTRCKNWRSDLIS